MCLNIPVMSVVVVVVAALVSLAAFYPPPPLSPALLQWQSQGQFFQYKEHSIFYMDVKGKGKQGPLLCLHGFPTFSHDWSKVLPGLQEQFSRVVLLDFLGFGLSDKPVSHNYSVFEQADIVTALASRLSVPTAHLLSHDFGDTVALELMHRHHQGVLPTDQPQSHRLLVLRSLTLLNGGVFPETNHPRFVQKLLLLPVIGPLLGRLTFFHVFKRGFGEIFGENKPSEEEYVDFYAGLCHKNGRHVTSGLLQYISERHANRERWVGALRDASVPVMMLYGPADPVNPSPQFPELFRREAPRHTLVVLRDNIGHYPQWEDPAAIVENMVTFLQRV